MKKVLIIDACTECRYRKPRNYRYRCELARRWLPRRKSMPSWCPLPNMETTVERVTRENQIRRMCR
jgi:hypothetical protein